MACGKRSGGESYAPDDIEALTQVAHGVGSALEAFDRADFAASRDGAIVAELRALREAVERRI